jgi:hypothetical protein
MWQHFCISNAKAAAESKTAPTLPVAAFSSQQHRGCSKAAPTILAASL